VLPITEQKFPCYFEIGLEFFMVFENFYVFISRHVLRPLTMLYITMVGTNTEVDAEMIRFAVWFHEEHIS